MHLPHLGVGCPGTWQEETKDTAEHPSVCRKTAHNIEGHLKRNCFNLCSLSVGSFLTYSVHLMLVHDRQLLQYLLNRTGAASGLTCRYFGKHDPTYSGYQMISNIFKVKREGRRKGGKEKRRV